VYPTLSASAISTRTRPQLLGEIQDVQHVYKIFADITALNSAIGTANASR
jgi:hypothetical protein